MRVSLLSIEIQIVMTIAMNDAMAITNDNIKPMCRNNNEMRYLSRPLSLSPIICPEKKQP
jgi:hypothetical protein